MNVIMNVSPRKRGAIIFLRKRIDISITQISIKSSQAKSTVGWLVKNQNKTKQNHLLPLVERYFPSGGVIFQQDLA